MNKKVKQNWWRIYDYDITQHASMPYNYKNCILLILKSLQI